MFLYYHSQFFVLCKFRKIYLGSNSELDALSHRLFSDIGLYYHVTKYCTFLMNHPLHLYLLTRSTTVTRYFKFQFFYLNTKRNIGGTSKLLLVI